MTFKKTSPVEVRQLGNGYIVYPGGHEVRSGMTTDDERLVFQSFAELSAWMEQHFDFRCHTVAADVAKPSVA